MQARILHAADYERMRWKNGGGWTTQLAVGAASDGVSAFDWRISIAEIESDGAFSAFAGCDRSIALLDGVGMELRFDDADAVRLDQRLKFFKFAGEANAFGKLLAGPVRDFNLIVRRDAIDAEILRRPLVGPMVFLATADTTWFVYVASGVAKMKSGGEIGTGESLLLEPDPALRNVVIDGGGELVLVKLVRRAPKISDDGHPADH
jgi:environmental stress-induced protein Ves